MEHLVAFVLGAGFAAIGWAWWTFPYIQAAALMEEADALSEEERAEEERWRRMCEVEK